MLHHCLATIIFCATCFAKGNTWEKALENKKAQLDLYWDNSTPFIYLNAEGDFVGIEVEIMRSFQNFLSAKYDVELTLNWKAAGSFFDVLKTVEVSGAPNRMGVAAISITEERQKNIQFSDAYLPDITVLVSSRGSPIVTEYEEIKRVLEDMVAVTIEGTKYESLLLELKEETNLGFEVQYIGSDQNILEKIQEAPDRFGFVDLPIYLILIEDGHELTRQNFFTVRGTGYGFAMPMGSDWSVPLNEFLNDNEYRKEIALIISKYLGTELYEFIDNLYEGDQLGTSILTKEKEIQLELIKNANLRLEEEQALKQLLILGILISSGFLLVIGILFYSKQKTAKLLLKHKNQIERQKEDIAIKNEQLINRNAQLISLNEAKNNLVKILAHDLRSPLNQIIGLSKVLPTRVNISKEDKELLGKISEGAERINQMIVKILDVDGLEGNQILVMRERVNVNHVIQDVASHYRDAALHKEIDIILELCDRHFTFETDHLILFLVLENLVSNAIKFSPEKQEITIQAICEDDKVIFKVSDHGPGFTEADKNMLYGQFQQLSAKPTAGEDSTGLGLSIVKKYVKDLGGEVSLESEYGKGSTFSVILPV